MSFSKVGPVGGWSMGAKLTSAAMNQLDADHALALDKSVAGDTLSGVVLMASTAQIAASNADNIIATAAGAITTGATGGIKSIVVAGITTTHAGGIAPQVAAGITDGGIATGIQATIADGIDAGVAKGIQSNVADGISGNVLGAIQADAAGALRSAVVGGIQLAGGATDWPTFSATRLRTNTLRVLSPRALASGWAVASFACQALVGPATSAVQYVPLDFLHDGATLQAIFFTFLVPNSHSSLPVNLPQFGVFKFDNGIFSGNFQTAVSLGPTTYQSPAPVSGSAWYNGGLNQSFEYVCSAGEVIVASEFTYCLAIVDENSTNSIAGNLYLGVQPAYTGIGGMAFP